MEGKTREQGDRNILKIISNYSLLELSPGCRRLEEMLRDGNNISLRRSKQIPGAVSNFKR